MKNLLDSLAELERIHAKLAACSRGLIDGNCYNVKVNTKPAVRDCVSCARWDPMPLGSTYPLGRKPLVTPSPGNW